MLWIPTSALYRVCSVINQLIRSAWSKHWHVGPHAAHGQFLFGPQRFQCGVYYTKS